MALDIDETFDAMSLTTVALVGHGGAQSGLASNPNIKTITKSGLPLYFFEAKEYMQTGKGALYPASSVGTLTCLSDDDCQSLFGSVPAKGQDFADTGGFIGGNVGGIKIYALRGQEYSIAQLGVYAKRNGWSIILMTCRDNSGPLGTIAAVSLGSGPGKYIHTISPMSSAASTPLTLAQVKTYIGTGNGKQFLTSTLGTFNGLTDQNCIDLFASWGPVCFQRLQQNRRQKQLHNPTCDNRTLTSFGVLIDVHLSSW